MLQRLISRTAAAALKPLGLELRRSMPWPPDAPEVPERLLAGCRVLPSRRHLLAILPEGGTAVEIGAAYGDFSESILQINKPRKLVLVDSWGSSRYRSGFDRVSERFAAEIAVGEVQITRGLSVDVMKRLPPQSFDWLYLDTVHDYPTTKAELDLAAALVVPGGYIAGHDFCTGNPTLALPYGVIPAVCEFCIERDFRFAYIALAPNGYFSFCLSASRVDQIDCTDDAREVLEQPAV